MKNRVPAIQVIFLPDGGSIPIVPPWKEGEKYHEDGGYIFLSENWEKGVLSVTKRVAAGYSISASVYICLLGDHLINLFESHLIEKIVEEGRKHSWGANVYVVVAQKVGLTQNQIREKAALSDWFDKVVEAGAADILEVDFDRNYGIGERAYLLANASARSRKRSADLHRLGSKDDWKAYLFDSLNEGKTRLSPFLQGFIIDPKDTSYSGNLLIIIDRTNPTDQWRLVKEALRKYKNSNPLVASYGEGIEAADELRRILVNRGIKLIDHEFRGPYELRYFFERMRKEPIQIVVNRIGDVREVELERSIFQAHDTGSDPCLLLTSTFHLRGLVSQQYCIQASYEAGQFTHRMPSHTVYHAHPALDGDILPDVLSKLVKSPPLTVWVYIGHGQKDGLIGYSSEIQSAMEWLSRFEVYRKSLALAFFSACQSSDVASLFARSGVGVSIGFEDDISVEASRVLGSEVISAALRNGGDPEMIVEAFHAGCTKLQAKGYSHSRPVAFRSRR